MYTSYPHDPTRRFATLVDSRVLTHSITREVWGMPPRKILGFRPSSFLVQFSGEIGRVGQAATSRVT